MSDQIEIKCQSDLDFAVDVLNLIKLEMARCDQNKYYSGKMMDYFAFLRHYFKRIPNLEEYKVRSYACAIGLQEFIYKFKDKKNN